MTDVYVDVLLGLNFVMNYIVLWAAGRLAGTASTVRRLVAAALVGSAYSLLQVLPVPGILTGIGARVLLSLVMVAIAYQPQIAGDWARTVGCLYLASVTAGGTAFMLSGLDLTIVRGPLPLLAAGAIAAVVLGRAAVRMVSGLNLNGMLTVPIRIDLGARQVVVTGLIDTGNQLRDPFSGLPVVVVDRAILDRLLPVDVAGDWTRPDTGLVGHPRLMQRFRVMPYRSLDRQGVMYGLRPDRVVLRDGGRELVTDRVVVGASPGPVSADGRVRALIPPELVWSRTMAAGSVQTRRSREEVTTDDRSKPVRDEVQVADAGT